MSILESIHSSADVKTLAPEQLPLLCGELRRTLIDTVSQTGGHLSSNLGAVELTVALHRVYDSRTDRILFDVGHQCYCHKLLTGRQDQFHTLRQCGGLSGFPKPYEAPDDAFISGHASTSVSVALGMARARTLQNESYDVVAVIGDGALTGGLAYEGLTNAAASGEPLVVVLNDNKMSINENVGGTASLLQSMRVKPAYISFKRLYRSVFSRLPRLNRFNSRIKEWLKSWLLPQNLFHEMGFEYLGPIDGHDVHKLELALRLARDMRQPVVLHVLTQKGRGCPYAEAQPEVYHGVGAFDPVSGAIHPGSESFSERFGAILCELAEKDERLVAITAAMASGTGLKDFAERYPARFFDVGIAEGHAVTMAAAMAKQGLLPVFAVYSSFLQRAYDMLLHDVSLQGLHLVLGVDRAGLVGNDGETHHGVFDLAYLSSVPGMQILCPASFQELRDMCEKALYTLDGPVAIRYPRGGEGRYTGSSLADETILREGSDLTLVCYGTLVNEALRACELLEEKGIRAELIKLGTIKPNAFALCRQSLGKTRRLLVAEEVCETGCVGRLLLAALGELPLRACRLLNLGDGIVSQATVPQLWRQYGLDAQGIAAAAAALVEKKEREA